MNRISFRGNRLKQTVKLMERPLNFIRRKSSKNDNDKKDESSQEEMVRKGILHDKQQSLQEESYFHKEEIEQLKELKKKFKRDKKSKDEKKED